MTVYDCLVYVGCLNIFEKLVPFLDDILLGLLEYSLDTIFLDGLLNSALRKLIFALMNDPIVLLYLLFMDGHSVS